jgi:hypothetical protein
VLIHLKTAKYALLFALISPNLSGRERFPSYETQASFPNHARVCPNFVSASERREIPWGPWC